MKLIVLKSAFRWFPEFFLVLSVMYYWISTANLLNPFAIVLLLLLGYQIYSNNRILGIIISTFVLLACAYLTLAIFSDVIKLESFYPVGFNLVFFGGLYLGVTAFFSGSLLLKHVNSKNPAIQLSRS